MKNKQEIIIVLGNNDGTYSLANGSTFTQHEIKLLEGLTDSQIVIIKDFKKYETQ